MTPWDGLNRRRFPRINYPCLVTVRGENKEEDSFLTHTENLGRGGVCVTLKKGLKIFSPVTVELDLLDMQDHILCDGKVVWSIRRKNDASQKPLFYDTGIEFTELKEQDVRRIDQIVQRLTRGGSKSKHP